MLRLNLQVEKVNRYPLINLNDDWMFKRMLSMSFLHVSSADIYQTIHTLDNRTTAKPILEFTYITASSPFASTNDSRVLTPKSTFYVIQVMCSYCDTIAISDILYEFELFWSQLSMDGFMSPRASESAPSYTHRVRDGLMIAANNRTINLTMLYWSQIYSILQLIYCAIYRTENIPCHSGPMIPTSHLPRPRLCGWTKGWFI